MTASEESARATKRYELLAPIASGGMATVHLGRMLGPGAFSRTVAIKKLYPHFASDSELVTMLLDEGWMAARIQHPNVVATLDLVRNGADLFLVMEYVSGVSLARLLELCRQAQTRVPLEIAVAIAAGVLHGLHAAHEARGDDGAPLEIVHRDVSPQNVIVGGDGVPRVIDFGVAKAVGRAQHTRDGEIKGKLPYMSPEQLRAGEIDRRADIWGAGVVAWEMIAGRPLFAGDAAQVMGEVLYGTIPALRRFAPDVPEEVERVVLQALERFPESRPATAREMALALERAVRPALPSEVGAWVEQLAAADLARLSSLVAAASAATPERILETQFGRFTVRPGSQPSPRPRRLTAPRAAVLGTAIAACTAGWIAWREATPHDARPSPVDPTASTMEETRREPVPVQSGGEDRADARRAPPSEAANPAPSPRSEPRPVEKKSPARAATTSAGSERRDEACYWLDRAGIWHIRPECL